MKEAKPVGGSAENEKMEHRLGVLLVHGVISQPKGETLGSWGDTLVSAIRQTVDLTGVSAIVESASPDGEENRLEAVLRLKKGGDEETWLLTEAWWLNPSSPLATLRFSHGASGHCPGQSPSTSGSSSCKCGNNLGSG